MPYLCIQMLGSPVKWQDVARKVVDLSTGREGTAAASDRLPPEGINCSTEDIASVRIKRMK